MSAQFIKTQALTNAWFCRALFLTLILIAFVNCSESLAFDYNDSDYPDPNAYARPTSTAFDNQERNQRLHLMLNYAKTQVPAIAPGLPDFVRNPSGWFGHGIGMNLGDAKNSADVSSSIIEPMQGMPASPSADAPEAMWLAPNYYHQGFLPFKDALIADAHLRHNLSENLLSNRMQLDWHPFYGQNWHSLDNYWGSEIALGLGAGPALQPSSQPSSQPWGKIALRYTSGDTNLTERGHGFDMHSELNFSECLSLNAGIRENGNSSSGNYVMLRWKLIGD
jgi:hypothetical protein